MSRGDLTSCSQHDFLLLWKEGEQGGERESMPSPSEEERLLFAMELTVGFMKECRGLSLGLSQGRGDWGDCGEPEEGEEAWEDRLEVSGSRNRC